MDLPCALCVCPRSLHLPPLQAARLPLYYKETPVLVLFCEFCEIFKNSFKKFWKPLRTVTFKSNIFENLFS